MKLLVNKEQRNELETLREQLTSYMEKLQDQVDYGLITQEERYRLLCQRFGSSYQQTLREINQLLHTKKSMNQPILALLTLICVSSLFIVSFSPTGLALSETKTLVVDEVITAQQNSTLRTQQEYYITALSVQLIQEAPNIYITHASGTSLLFETATNTCVGCQQLYKPPLTIHVIDGGAVHIRTISYT